MRISDWSSDVCSSDLFAGGAMAETENTESSATEALIDLAVDSWKFARLFTRVISKLDAGEQARYANQVRFFQKRIQCCRGGRGPRSEEHTSELQSLMRISYAAFCLKQQI